MGLGKILKLGGIDNSPPKTDQDVGRFRVARNVLPTPDGTLIPRYDYEVPAAQPANIRGIHHIFNYDNSPISIVGEDIYSAGIPGAEYVKFYNGSTGIPTWCAPMESYISAYEAQSFQSYRVNNTTYVMTPEAQSNLLKYDGVEVGPAGCMQPFFAVASADLVVPAVAANRRYIRVIAHTIDFDKNEPVSEYVQFTSGNSGATAEIQYTAGTPALYTQIPAIVSEVVPQTKLSDLGIAGNYYLASSVTYTGSPSFEFTVTCSAANTNINEASRVGSYVFVAGNYTRSAAILGGSYPEPIYGIALKVKSTSTSLGTTTIKLHSTNAYVMTANREWRLEDLSAYGATMAAGLNTYLVGCRYFLTYWEATSATGIYYFRDITPYLPASSDVSVTTRTSLTMTGVASASTGFDTTLFTISSSLNGVSGWYDVNTKKLSPNSSYDFVDGGKFYALTKFQGQLLLAGEDYIWFSDTTLGGWVEQLNAANSLLIGDMEYGRITAICGTQDFLFVGRERKNYIVVGNIATGNYKVQEMTETEVGPWCNNSAINVKDTVVFINTVGVFQITGGGRCQLLSAQCPKNFGTFSNNSINEDVVFRMTGYTSVVTDAASTSEVGLAVAYDAFRDLLVWMKRDQNNACLVLHTRTSEFYEWDGLLWGNTDLWANNILFIQSHYYLGGVDYDFTPYSKRGFYAKEDKTLARTYSSTYPVKLYTTWLTNGEPSLEKEILQLKMFGRIACSSTYPIKVRHYKDWDTTTLITDTTYYPTLQGNNIDNQIQYSHKKRLTSDKALAVSVGIELSGNDRNFELESLELEMNAIQAGVKR